MDLIDTHQHLIHRDRLGYGWTAGIPALAEGRVCALPAERFELLVRPGPRVGEAALRLVDCLHGLPPIGAVAR